MKDIKTLAMPALIVANGVAYLGTIVEEKSKVTIQDAMALGTPSKITPGHLSDYLANAFSDKLTTTNIGPSSPWSTTNLDESLTLSWQIAQLRLEQAIKTAPVDAVLTAFRNIKE